MAALERRPAGRLPSSPSSSAARRGWSAAEVDGLDLIVLDAPHLYDRPGNPYLGPDGKDWPDNWQRFAALSFAAAELARGAVDGLPARHPPRPRLAGGAGAGLCALQRAARRRRRCMTVHNIAFQGVSGWDVFPQLELPTAGLRTRRRSSTSAASASSRPGCSAPTALTTVSPTYAHEITTAALRHGARRPAAAARRRRSRHSQRHRHERSGTPATDPALPQPTARARSAGRAANKRARSRSASGSTPAPAPLFVRGQPAHLAEGHGPPGRGDRRARRRRAARLAVLGSGEPALEDSFRRRGAAASGQGRRRHRLRRGLQPPDAGRRRRDPDPVALRALRADPALRPALRLRAGGQPRRRARRHGDRRQRGGGRGRRRHRLRSSSPADAASARARRSAAPSRSMRGRRCGTRCSAGA